MCWTKKKDFFCPRCHDVVSRETRDEICPPDAPCSKRDKRPLEVLYKNIRVEQPCRSCKNGDNPNASRIASTHQGNTNRYVSPEGMPSNRVQTVNSNYLAPPQDYHRNPAPFSPRYAGREGGGGSGRAQVSSRQFVADQGIERGGCGTAGRRATGAGSGSHTTQVIERAMSQSGSRRTGGGGGGGAPVQPNPTVIERASSSSASRRTATGGGGGQLELFNPRNQGYNGSASARSASGTSTQRYVNDANGQLVPVQASRRGGTVVVPSGSSSSSSRHVAPRVSGNVHSGSSSSGAHHIRINIEISYYSGSSGKH